MKELTANIMKSGVKMEHPPGMVIKASGRLRVKVSV